LPLTGIDRRTRRRLSRGETEIDDRIDLHGLSVEAARVALRGFLAAARTRGSRLVLVITGKGASPFTQHTLHGTSHFHAPERQGRLRRLVVEWLSEPEFRMHVSGFQPAHPRHGGGGALYVRLRRPRVSGE
jgi:DNA-nicking Smr family endonuclease